MRFSSVSEAWMARPPARPLPSSASRLQARMLSSLSDELTLSASPKAAPLPLMLLPLTLKLVSGAWTARPPARPLPSSASRPQFDISSFLSDVLALSASPRASPLPLMLLWLKMSEVSEAPPRSQPASSEAPSPPSLLSDKSRVCSTENRGSTPANALTSAAPHWRPLKVSTVAAPATPSKKPRYRASTTSTSSLPVVNFFSVSSSCRTSSGSSGGCRFAAHTTSSFQCGKAIPRPP
mmetsp:Transcript_8194/g.26723  ORF Transcript_8194/g.26723 Transcript_8194/m.26723 type:complete len:237 (+) Transcript_8194:411-1121(+)